MEMIKRPYVDLDFNGPGGNSVSLLSACIRAARKSSWPEETVTNWKNEAMCSTRGHLLDMIFEHFDVAQTVVQSVAVNRGAVI